MISGNAFKILKPAWTLVTLAQSRPLTARSTDGASDTEAVAVLRDGAILLANSTFLRFWWGRDGAPAWHEVIGDAETRGVPAAGGAAVDREIELHQGDGRTIRRRIRIEPLHGTAGERAVLVRIAGDSTAASADEVRQRAGELAHDLNNAIGSILLNAHLALDALGEADPGHTDVEEMRKAGESAAAVTRRLQALSRGERA
jgi:signal transduction histidine kinase